MYTFFTSWIRPNNISNDKNSHITLQTAILNLYNKIFINAVFPITWAVVTIIPIAKRDKDPYYGYRGKGSSK